MSTVLFSPAHGYMSSGLDNYNGASQHLLADGPPQELLDLAEDLSNQKKVNPLLDERLPSWVRWILGYEAQAFTAVLIMANVGVIGMETEIPEGAEYLEKLQLMFLVFFAVEVALRIIAEGVFAGVNLDPPRCEALAFFRGPEYMWNLLDFGVVMLGCADALLQFLNSDGHKKKGVNDLVTLLRFVRILRILRMLRVVKTLAPNSYRLIVALLNAIQVLRWIMILFLVIIVLSAVLFTNVARDYADDETVSEEIEMYWGGILKSMYSLFQVVTLDDWAVCTRCLTEKNVWIYLMMVCFIIVTSFTVMSLLTGVISDNVIVTAENDEEEKMKEAGKARMKFAKALREMFEEADKKQSTRGVTRSALKSVVSHFHHPALKEKMDGIQFPYKDVERASHLKRIATGAASSDAEATPEKAPLVDQSDEKDEKDEEINNHPLLRLFDLLDTDRSGDLDWYELRAGLGCPAEGEVQSKDMLAFEAECRRFGLQLQKAKNTTAFKNGQGPKIVQDSIGLAQAISLKFQASMQSVDEIKNRLA
jgi:hypothetical protein